MDHTIQEQLSAMNDAELLALFFDPDNAVAEQVFAFLQLRYWDILRRIAARWLGSWDEAEEVVQEVFIRLFEVRVQVRRWSIREIFPYLCRAVRSRCGDHWRNPGRGEVDDAEVLDRLAWPGPSPESSLLRKERARSLRDCRERLKPRLQQVVDLRAAYVDGKELTNIDIAEILGVKEYTATRRWESARVQLMRCLKEKGLRPETRPRRAAPDGVANKERAMNEFMPDEDTELLADLRELLRLESDAAAVAAEKRASPSCLTIFRAGIITHDPSLMTADERMHIVSCKPCQRLLGKFKVANVVEFTSDRHVVADPRAVRTGLYFEPEYALAAGEKDKSIRDLGPHSKEISVFDSPARKRSGRLLYKIYPRKLNALYVSQLTGDPMFLKLTGKPLSGGSETRIESDPELTIAAALDMALAFAPATGAVGMEGE